MKKVNTFEFNLRKILMKNEKKKLEKIIIENKKIIMGKKRSHTNQWMVPSHGILDMMAGTVSSL